jgi:hypothetical protein
MPAGTFINGSVMRFEERFEPSHYFVLGLMVDNVEIQGRQVAIKLAPMSQNAMPVLSGPKQGLQLRPWNAQLGPFPIERRPWVGTFLFRTGSDLILDSKFVSDWVALPVQIEHQER